MVAVGVGAGLVAGARRIGVRAVDVGAQGRMVAGRYRLCDLLGRGGMGAVWRAFDETLGREIALKELRLPDSLDDDERARRSARAVREVRAAALVRHPHVVVVHDIVEDDGRPWIVMELVEGRPLSDVLVDGRMSAREAAAVVRDLVEGLATVHAAGVVHRDVKPANVMLTRARGAVLTDFGIATLAGAETLTATGATIGTLEYMAPERCQGLTPVPASDLWSLGVTLYEMVEGRSPFRRTGEFATMAAVLDGRFDEPRFAGPLTGVLNGLLTGDPDARMTAAQALPLLEAVADGRAETQAVGEPEPAQAPAQVPTRPLPTRRRRVTALAVTGAAVATAAVAGGVYALGGSGGGGGRASAGAASVGPTTTAPRIQGSAPAPAPTATASTAYRTVTDPAGFTVLVPTAWTGPHYDGGRVFYYDQGNVRRLGVRVDPPDATGSPYNDLAAQDADGTGASTTANYPGYQRISLTRTTFGPSGATAARWEFTSQAGGIARRTIDLRYTSGGHTYDFWISGPDTETPTLQAEFDHARSSFTPA